ncbi:AKT-interacting protein-like isoform X3 [Tachypleus tridentatus]|uniref:AKT-interacting protein-like isoform X3 n=1 Tax=Tachypleus tridentatus TaxID=6853 RepID=UPI003FD1B555
MTEHVMLQRRRLPGVYVVPSAGSPLKWFGVLFIWQGHYQGGVFRFTLYMPHNYPDGDCPVVMSRNFFKEEVMKLCRMDNNCLLWRQV